MAKRDITSCRTTLEFLHKEGDLLKVKGEVDPIYEVSGVAKALDNGPALLFERVKGYPGHRIVSNLFSRADRVAKIFDVADPRRLKFKGLDALKNPVASRVVDSAPCQEVVVTREIDVPGTLPVIKHTETDPGRIIGGGNVLISGKEIGHCVSFKRIHFRGKDWASLAFNPETHFEHWVLEHRKERKNLPLTINICPSPAVMVVAGGGAVHGIVPAGSDELAIAGGLQGVPIDICRAKTVEAYSIADSEWVIEGYVDTSEVVWESEVAEKTGDFTAPFFPEFDGHQGRARTTYKFQATAITHRKDNPILYAPLAHSLEQGHMHAVISHATIYELLDRLCPGLVVDVNVPGCLTAINGIAIQVRKRRRRDEEYIPNLILTALASSHRPRMVMVVDEDVDIYNADDVMWALVTRVDAKDDIVIVPPGVRAAGIRGEAVGPRAPAWRMGVDATAPFEHKWAYARGQYPAVDLEKWLTKEEIDKIQAQQSQLARLFARRRD